MNVTLTPDLEQALVQRARQHGITPEAAVLDAVRKKAGAGTHRIGDDPQAA
jgi:hypothetical protein